MSAGQARSVLYPDLYCWYVLLAALDIIVTALVLDLYGMIEANALAAKVIDQYGLAGLVPYKFASVILVVLICEYVGKLRPATGLRIARLAVGVSCLPILAAAVQLAFAQPMVRL
ncbi:MAG: hypothetical protein D6695_10635 [Planctomycetota bacterium]|nr:MAG: hypothetical protein D6695_10635 [Planctomycetota bacterium]